MRSCMNQCGLTEIPATGRFYTWTNKQEGEKRVFSKIDRFLANSDWVNMFQSAGVQFLPEEDFDHTPMMIRAYPLSSKKKPFRFCNHWCLNEKFIETVQEGWNTSIEGYKMFKIIQKLKTLKQHLKSMDSRGQSEIHATALRAKERLLQVQDLMHQFPDNPEYANQEKEAQTSYKQAWTEYHTLLHQRAKLHWLKEGDENSKVFHNSIKARKVHNTINAIQLEDGTWADTPETVSKAFINFYKNLLGTKASNRVKVNQEIVDLGGKIQDHHRDILKCEITKDEIRKAMFAIPNNKAPGLDGYNSQFFKSTWDIVGDEVSEAILDFFHNGKLLTELNITTVTLVPKISVPCSTGDYRPIACCNTIYKCITKLMCDRLNKVLPDIISSNQGAFISERNIMHNVLVCQDLITM